MASWALHVHVVHGVIGHRAAANHKEKVEELGSGKYAIESIALDEMEARILGDTAIVTYYQSEKSKTAGQSG